MGIFFSELLTLIMVTSSERGSRSQGPGLYRAASERKGVVTCGFK